MYSIAGKLLGLHTGTGRVMWSLHFPAGMMPSHLLPWRSSHDTMHAPEVLALSPTNSGHTSYAVLDAHQGTLLDAGSIPFAVSQVRIMRHANAVPGP